MRKFNAHFHTNSFIVLKKKKMKKDSRKDYLSKDEVNTLKEIAEIMRKEDTLWGL